MANVDYSTASSNLEAAALSLAAAGFAVFPLQPRSKEPYPGSHGFRDATTDANVIRKLWSMAPNSNIGVRPPATILVVDIDPRNGGDDTLERLEEQHGKLPATLWAMTGGGGAHFYFRKPDGWRLPSTLGAGVDVKGESGYLVAPPSVHVSGGVYHWASPLGTLPIADAPAWLLALGWPAGERASVQVVDEDERKSDDATLDRVVDLVAPHFVRGKMHDICKNLAAWLKQRGFGFADASYVIGRLPCRNTRNGLDAARAAFAIDKSFGYAELKELIGAVHVDALDAVTPNPRRERELADLDAAKALIPAMAASVSPPLTLAPPPLPVGANMPVIVGDARGSQFWVLRGADYFPPVAKGMLPARCRQATGDREKSKADDLAAAATIAEKVVRDFAAAGITWQSAERAIVHGYQQPEIAPVYDAQVDAWLRALSGERHDYLAQWFATCAQSRIQKLAACLVLIGGTGIGKTLIALLASRMWGASSPVPLAHAIDRFNSTITKCPIVLDDEAARMKQGDVATNDFREMLSARERTYEPKGVDKRELRGCQRFVITCNAFSDLRFSDVGALEVVEALADRLLVVPCGPADAVRAALQPLRLPGTDDVDLARLDGHVAWLVANTPVTTTRFLASPGRNDPAARQAVLDGLVQQHPDLFDQVRQALERGEHAAPVEPPAVFVHGGLLWVRGDRVSARLDARDVFRALAPWELAPRRDFVKVAGSSVRARAYDLGRLATEAVTPVTPVTPVPHSPQAP